MSHLQPFPVRHFPFCAVPFSHLCALTTIWPCTILLFRGVKALSRSLSLSLSLFSLFVSRFSHTHEHKIVSGLFLFPPSLLAICPSSTYISLEKVCLRSSDFSLSSSPSLLLYQFIPIQPQYKSNPPFQHHVRLFLSVIPYTCWFFPSQSLISPSPPFAIVSFFRFSFISFKNSWYYPLVSFYLGWLYCGTSRLLEGFLKC